MITLPGTGRVEAVWVIYVLLLFASNCVGVLTFFFLSVLSSTGPGKELYAYDLCITNWRSEDLLKVPELIDIACISLQARQRRMDQVLVLQWCVLLFPRLCFGCSSIVQVSDLSSI